MTRWSSRAAVLAGMAAIGIVPPAAAQSGGTPFEGTVSMRLSAKTPKGTQSQEMEYLMRGGKLRINVAGPMGGMAMLAVPQEKKMYMLMAAQNAYMEMSLPDAANAAKSTNGPVEDVKITRTGRKEQVAGLTCEHVQMSSKSGATDVCLTKELGRFVNPMEGMRASAGAPWQKQIANEFPLKVTMPDGSVPLEVTKVERKRLANDLFSVPEHYTKMAMPAGRPPA